MNYHKLTNALKIGYWAFKNPQTLQQSTFEMLSKVLELIMKVSTEDRHMMTHIAYIHPETGTENSIVSIWAGAGAAAEPVKRIGELQAEISRLKLLLSESTFNKQA